MSERMTGIVPYQWLQLVFKIPGLSFERADDIYCWLLWKSQALAGRLVCPRKGHDWYSDMCRLPEHDLCYRCEVRRDKA